MLRLLSVVMLVGSIGLAFAGDPAMQLDIRAEDGTVLIAADQVLTYDWATHTLTLKPGVRKNLFIKLKGSLANGYTFGVAVGGKTIYHGVFKSIISSSSSSSPVILLDEAVYEPKLLKESQVRIVLGYPGKEHFKGEDPRGDPRVEKALKASGKLTKPKTPETHIPDMREKVKLAQAILGELRRCAGLRSAGATVDDFVTGLGGPQMLDEQAPLRFWVAFGIDPSQLHLTIRWQRLVFAQAFI